MFSGYIFSDRQDSDDDSILDPEPTRLTFNSSEVIPDKKPSPKHKTTEAERNTAKVSTNIPSARYFPLFPICTRPIYTIRFVVYDCHHGECD